MSVLDVSRPAINPPITQSAIMVEAERWLGTPYCHQAARRGVGADCLGLVVGVWQAVSGTKVALTRANTRAWARHAKGEPLLDGLRQVLVECPVGDAQPGDVLALRWRHTWPASHLSILMDDETMIHAYEGGQVVRSHLAPWVSHAAAAFVFPISL
ncbi:MAG: NlpC/P60 family protein [Pseudomonadota bacterium]